MSEFFASPVDPATAVSELLVLLTLIDHPVDEHDLEACGAVLDGLRQASPHFERLLAPVTHLHLIEALGHLHSIAPLEAARQKHARDLGKALAFLPTGEKVRLCRAVESFLDVSPGRNGADLYQTFLSRMA